MLLSRDEAESSQALAYIIKNKPVELIPRLRNILISPDEENESRAIALRALSSFSATKYLDIWFEILRKTPSFIIKKEIISIIIKTNNRKIIVPLVEQLSSPYYTVRESAIFALKRYGDDRMFPYILNMARNDNPVFRVYALEAIYYLYDIRLYPIILSLLDDPNKSVRYYALRCIEKNRLNKASSNVRSLALKDKNHEVRVKAIEVLGVLKDSSAYSVVLKCLDDSHRDIRYASVKALYKMKTRKSASPLSRQLYEETEDDIKRLIIDTLIRLKDGGGFKGLEKVLLNDQNPELRIHAAYAYGTLGNKKSLPSLLRGLRDKDYRVRAEVCSSLGQFKDKRILPYLLGIINDDTENYVRTASLYAIKRMKEKKAVLPLFDRYVGEKDPIFKDKLRAFLRHAIDRFI